MASATASDLTTDTVLDLLRSRKAECEREVSRIDRAIEALSTTNGTGRRVGRPRTRPALPAGGKTARAPRTKRSRKGGTRAEQALGMVQKAGEKGIDASAIAKAMKIKPNYLYRVMDGLVKEKQVRKDGRKYFSV